MDWGINLYHTIIENKMNSKAALQNLVIKFKKTSDLGERMIIAKKHTEILLGIIGEMGHDIKDHIPECETWANVNGYYGIYQISSWGRLKSIERIFIKNRKGGKSKMAVFQPEKIRTMKNNTRYPQYGLWLNGKVKHHSAHKLVATYFIENTNNYPQVLHNDNNTKNPRWDNLRWGTQSQNIQQCSDSDRGFRGSKNNNSKLKEEDIPIIRKLISDGISCRKIGEIYGVSGMPIESIKSNKSWKHVK